MSDDSLNLISNLVASQFPAFYQEEGPNFVAFVKAYYEWLESEGAPVGVVRSISNWMDIDKTPDQFIVYFKEKYLKNIQFTTASNKRLFIKNSLDFYRAKGTERAIDLFFQLIYGIDADVYYPGDDLFKLSAGEWVRPIYLEVTRTERNISYVGKQVTGVVSGATAFIDRLVRRRVQGKFIDIFYISSLEGNFETTELLSIGDSDLTGAPAVIGSLTTLQIVSGGHNFDIGDTVNIESMNGAQGVATVTATTNATGEVQFTLIDGGFGYTSNADVIISSKVLVLNQIALANTNEVTTFLPFDEVIQPLALLSYSNLTGPAFAAGKQVFEYNANGVVTGFGTIITASPINSTAGQIFCSVGQFSPGNVSNLQSNITFWQAGNTGSASLTGYLDQTATANVFAQANVANVVVTLAGTPFQPGETVAQGNTTGTVTNVLTIGSNSTITVANISAPFIIGGANVVGLSSTATGVPIDFQQAFGLTSLVNSFGPYGNVAPVYGSFSKTAGDVIEVSQGTAATFSIGALAYPEQVTLSLDFLGGVNTGNVPYMSVRLDGSNSNTGVGGYGFPKDPPGGQNTVIYSCLGYEQATIGSIASITGINPGHDYNLDPFVLVVQPEVAAYAYHDAIANVGHTMVNRFVNGEIVTQSQPIPSSATLTITVTSANSFQTGEIVYQSNGTANVATGNFGVSQLANGTGTVTITNVNGAFTTAYALHGFTSGANATVSSASNSAITTARALVRNVTTDVSNNVNVYLKRISFEQMQNNLTITGSTSRATANVLSLSDDFSHPVLGENAIILANTAAANGIVANLEVIDSGFGYNNAEITSFSSLDGTNQGTVRVLLGFQGEGQGYYKSSKGFLSDSPKVLDSDFYQEYSYEVLTRLPFDVYADTLKKVLHVAGTRAFGGVILSSNTPVVTAPPIAIPFAHSNVDIAFVNATANGTFLVGETVVQGNTQAVVVAPAYAALTFNANVKFETGSVLSQGSNASGPIFAISNGVFYISPLAGSFTAGQTVTGQTGQRITMIPKYELGLALPQNANVFTGSYIPGELAYQSNGTANTVTGIIVNANSSIAEFEISTGSLALNQQLIGATSGAQANVVTVNSQNSVPTVILYPGDMVNQLSLRFELVGSTGTFHPGDVVFQNERVRSIDTPITFMNTAIGTVLSANATQVSIYNFFGNFSNNEILYSSTSNTVGTINAIDNLVTAQGLVESANTTSVTVFTTTGRWQPNASVYDANSDVFAVIQAVAPVTGNGVVNTALNTLVLSNTFSTLTRGVAITGNGPITGLTSNTTAFVLSTDVEIL